MKANKTGHNEQTVNNKDLTKIIIYAVWGVILSLANTVFWIFLWINPVNLFLGSLGYYSGIMLLLNVLTPFFLMSGKVNYTFARLNSMKNLRDFRAVFFATHKSPFLSILLPALVGCGIIIIQTPLYYMIPHFNLIFGGVVLLNMLSDFLNVRNITMRDIPFAYNESLKSWINTPVNEQDVHSKLDAGYNEVKSLYRSLSKSFSEVKDWSKLKPLQKWRKLSFKLHPDKLTSWSFDQQKSAVALYKELNSIPELKKLNKEQTELVIDEYFNALKENSSLDERTKKFIDKRRKYWVNVFTDVINTHPHLVLLYSQEHRELILTGDLEFITQMNDWKIGLSESDMQIELSVGSVLSKLPYLSVYDDGSERKRIHLNHSEKRQVSRSLDNTFLAAAILYCMINQNMLVIPAVVGSMWTHIISFYLPLCLAYVSAFSFSQGMRNGSSAMTYQDGKLPNAKHVRPKFFNSLRTSKMMKFFHLLITMAILAPITIWAPASLTFTLVFFVSLIPWDVFMMMRVNHLWMNKEQALPSVSWLMTKSEKIRAIDEALTSRMGEANYFSPTQYYGKTEGFKIHKDMLDVNPMHIGGKITECSMSGVTYSANSKMLSGRSLLKKASLFGVKLEQSNGKPTAHKEKSSMQNMMRKMLLLT